MAIAASWALRHRRGDRLTRRAGELVDAGDLQLLEVGTDDLADAVTRGSFDHDFLRAVGELRDACRRHAELFGQLDFDAQGLWSGSRPARMRASPARVASSEVRGRRGNDRATDSSHDAAIGSISTAVLGLHGVRPSLGSSS